MSRRIGHREFAGHCAGEFPLDSLPSSHVAAKEVARESDSTIFRRTFDDAR